MNQFFVKPQNARAEKADKNIERGKDVSEFYLNLVSSSKEEEKAAAEKEAPSFCGSCQVEAKAGHESSTSHQLCSKDASSTVGSGLYGISEVNRGFQMLLGGGWNREKGVGPPGKEGRQFPVKTVLKRDRKGIGCETSDKPRVTHYPEPDEPVTKIKKASSIRVEKAATVAKRLKAKKEIREKTLARNFRREFLNTE